MLILGLTLLTLVFYSGLRALFLFWNYPLFKSLPGGDLALTFWYGLRFDFSAVAMLAIPALLVGMVCLAFKRSGRTVSYWTFLLFQVPFLIINSFDTEFVQFTGRRFSLASMTIVTGGLSQFWTTVFSYWSLILITSVVMLVYLTAAWRWRRRADLLTPQMQGSTRLASGLIGLVLLVLAARGGWQSKPIGFAHAQVFSNPVLNHLTMNSSFSFLQTLKRTGLPREHYMSEARMRELMNGSVPGESIWQGRPALEGPQNVVVILLESFSLEHLGRIHGDTGYTPFLDELSAKGLFFPNAFANARRSIEGIAAVLGGIPALMSEPFISSQYATNQFFGIGTALGAHGYSSAFYHGGNNGTMYFDQFARSAGLQRYFGSSEYGDSHDHDGTWGIWDEPFLQRLALDLGNQKEPFLVSLFTLSSHNPFRVPADKAGVFPKGTSEIHEVVGYSDFALRRFFETASQQPWFKRTLFVVTADHTFKPTRPRYQNSLGDYRIPLLFYHPGITQWPQVETREPVQQIDILPSILDFLGQPATQQNLLGRSVFRSGPRYVTLSSEGFYWLVTRDHVLTMDAKGQSELRALEDHLVPAELPARSLSTPTPASDAQLKAELNERLFATRQYFSEGLWDNKLYFPSGR